MPDDVPSGWTEANHALTRTVRRADFVEALAFVLEVGRLAEAANHHPDITIHRYRQVDLSLSTHSAGHTVTPRDYALAQKINDLDEQVIRFTRDELAGRFRT
jgi:4a-hydroxytetrahydrobiopterin dehydratase